MVNEAPSMLIHVIYAGVDHIWRKDVDLAEGSTVRDALQASGFFNEFPEMLSREPPVGIFGRRCAYDEILNQRDRVEVYRPLVFDPMESRRRRASRRERLKRSDTARQPKDT